MMRGPRHMCLLVALCATPAWAQDCTGPAAPLGTILYNPGYDVTQVCTSARGWVALHGETGYLPGPGDCPNSGDTCGDGSIFVWLSPEDNAQMFTTSADAPSTYTWNDGTVNYSSTGATSATDGEGNTATLVALTGNSDYPFGAAEFCNGLSAHGHSDWYLPAEDELNFLYTKKNIGDLNGTFDESGPFSSVYWSSSESDSDNAIAQSFDAGVKGGIPKDTAGLSVRCVRK